MMFALGPVVIAPWMIGKALVALSVSAVVTAAVAKARKWLASDKHKDIVVFMGPKMQGKSEFVAALRREPFDPNRDGTSPSIGSKECAVEDDDLGKHKKAIVFDSDGASNNIKSYVKGVVDYINRVSPEYALVVLVINRAFLSEEVVVAADELAEYLYFWVTSCCKEIKSKNLKMGYALVLTCCKKTTENEDWWLREVSKRLEDYKGNMKRMDGKKPAYFELSEEKSRNEAIKWLSDTLKRLHKE
jgi:hypothetical protein